MDFRSEAPAVVVRLGTAAPDTYMRKLAFIGAIAAILLKLVADFILVELLREICTKLERELHNKIEVLGSLALSLQTRPSTTSPLISSLISLRSLWRGRRCWKSHHLRTAGKCQLFLSISSW